MNLTSKEDVASLCHFARMTESDEVAMECRRIVDRLVSEGRHYVDNPSIIVNMAVRSLDPDRDKRFQAVAGNALISSLASFGREHP